MLQEIIEKRKSAIANLEKALNERLALIYSKKKSKDIKKKDELDITIEILRLSINVLGQEIDMLNTSKPKSESIKEESK